jgi:hypothetical protein
MEWLLNLGLKILGYLIFGGSFIVIFCAFCVVVYDGIMISLGKRPPPGPPDFMK